MKRARGNEAGVTLLELLVAVSLVALLSVGMLMALHTSLDGSAKADQRLTDNRRVIGVERILREQIADMIPVNTVCAPQPGTQGPPIPLFEGAPGAMRFVSTYSLDQAGRGRARLLEFKVIPGENGNGVRLIVNERLYTGSGGMTPLCVGFTNDAETSARLPEFAPIETGPFSFVLADKLAYCRLSYLEPRRPPELQRWTPLWVAPAGIQASWPEAVRVDLAPLVNQPAALQLTSVTVPVRVNRDPSAEYRE